MKDNNLINSVLIFLVAITLGIAAFLLGYQWAMDKCDEIKSPYEPERIETYIYSLEPGEDGLIRFSVDEDSLAYVVFVQDGDTFALDALVKSEFDSLVNVLYPKK